MVIGQESRRLLQGILFKTGDFTYQVPRLDSSTHAIATVDYAHHEIHGGSSFTTYYTRTTDATAGHRSALYLLTPSDKEIHLIASFSASTSATFSMCEGVTIDVNEGTNTVVIYNRERNSSKTSSVSNNATVPAKGFVTSFTEAEIAAANFSAGTILRTEPLQVGTGPKPAGGSGRGSQEYILKKSTKYVFRITNVAASANVHHILLDWYEHTKRSS